MIGFGRPQEGASIPASSLLGKRLRHAGRAAALLRRLMKVPELAFERALGMSPAALAEYAETAAKTHAALQATAPGQPQPVFNFILGSNGRPSGQASRRLL